MPVSSVSIKDAANVNRPVAALYIDGKFYQVSEPHVVVARILSSDEAGDETLISAVPVVVRSVRMFNGGPVACHAKLHNLAVSPTVGVTAVAYAAHAQAGENNPDPRVTAGGVEFTTGLGVTIVTGIPDDDTTGVAADKVDLEIEYHLAGGTPP